VLGQMWATGGAFYEAGRCGSAKPARFCSRLHSGNESPDGSHRNPQESGTLRLVLPSASSFPNRVNAAWSSTGGRPPSFPHFLSCALLWALALAIPPIRAISATVWNRIHWASRWEGDFSVRIRLRGYQPTENHRWEVSLSTGIGITKHYAVGTKPLARQTLRVS